MARRACVAGLAVGAACCVVTARAQAPADAPAAAQPIAPGQVPAPAQNAGPAPATASPAPAATAPPAAAPASTAAATTPATCAKADFEAVVDDAAGVLRDLNQKNKPAFQDKLRTLKDKRGWDHETFLAQAEPYVRDDQIGVYDKQSEEMLSKISTMGQEGADAKTPDCKLLAQLKGFMQTLVELQTKKWAYMSDKLDGELAK